jgi:hypothetical protein
LALRPLALGRLLGALMLRQPLYLCLTTGPWAMD